MVICGVGLPRRLINGLTKEYADGPGVVQRAPTSHAWRSDGHVIKCYTIRPRIPGVAGAAVTGHLKDEQLLLVRQAG